jgi:hypothetical protein
MISHIANSLNLPNFIVEVNRKMTIGISEVIQTGSVQEVGARKTYCSCGGSSDVHNLQTGENSSSSY